MDPSHSEFKEIQLAVGGRKHGRSKPDTPWSESTIYHCYPQFVARTRHFLEQNCLENVKKKKQKNRELCWALTVSNTEGYKKEKKEQEGEKLSNWIRLEYRKEE